MRDEYYGIIYIGYKIPINIGDNVSKFYIGQTCRNIGEYNIKKLLCKRVAGHFNINRKKLLYIQQEIKKDPNDWQFDVLRLCFSQEDLNYYEMYYINKYDSLVSGYNRTIGGQSGGRLTQEHKNRISFGVRTSKKYKEGIKNRNFSVDNNPFYGRNHSEKLRKSVSIRMSMCNIGNAHTKGMIWCNNGKEERRFHPNSIQTGFVRGKLKRRWITNGIKTYSILFESTVPDGFRIGRTFKGA